MKVVEGHEFGPEVYIYYNSLQAMVQTVQQKLSTNGNFKNPLL